MNTIKVSSDSMYPYSKLEPIPKGQVEFSKIHFLFSDGWDGKNKIAQFEQGEHLYNKEISDGFCTVPAELDLGSCMLYVKGYDTEGMPQIATANGLVLLIVQGARNGGTPAVPPPPDLYAQLLAKVDGAVANVAPIIRDKTWYVWSAVEGDYVSTGICAEGLEPEPVADSEFLKVMHETGLVDPVVDEEGALFVGDDNTLFIL